MLVDNQLRLLINLRFSKLLVLYGFKLLILKGLVLFLRVKTLRSPAFFSFPLFLCLHELFSFSLYLVLDHLYIVIIG